MFLEIILSISASTGKILLCVHTQIIIVQINKTSKFYSQLFYRLRKKIYFYLRLCIALLNMKNRISRHSRRNTIKISNIIYHNNLQKLQSYERISLEHQNTVAFRWQCQQHFLLR